MKTIIDQTTWKRKEHFDFFRQFDNPFYGITSVVDATVCYETANSRKESFFIHYLYCVTRAINEVEELRYRIEGNEVVCYDKIHVSSTIGREDGTFGFSFIPYDSSFERFRDLALAEIKKVKQDSGLCLSETTERKDTIHFSPIPWVNFTALQHPMNYQTEDSVPKICVGKFSLKKGRKMLPVSIHAHHGLSDGYHAGRFFDRLQVLMGEK